MTTVRIRDRFVSYRCWYWPLRFVHVFSPRAAWWLLWRVTYFEVSDGRETFRVGAGDPGHVAARMRFLDHYRAWMTTQCERVT